MVKAPSMVVRYLLIYMLKAHMLAFSCSHTSIVGNLPKIHFVLRGDNGPLGVKLLEMLFSNFSLKDKWNWHLTQFISFFWSCVKLVMNFWSWNVVATKSTHLLKYTKFVHRWCNEKAKCTSTCKNIFRAQTLYRPPILDLKFSAIQNG